MTEEKHGKFKVSKYFNSKCECVTNFCFNSI